MMSTVPESDKGTIRVEVVFATPQRQQLLELRLPAGSTARQAIEQSGICDKFPEMEIDPAAIGIFSRKVEMDQVLQHGDRVEIYRPLIADPKESRRRRAKADKQGRD